MKKFWTIIITNAICMLLASCSHSEGQTEENVQTEKSEPSVQSSTTNLSSSGTSADITVGDQTFHVISLHEDIMEYAAAVEKNASVDKKEVYREKVVRPLRKQVAETDAHIYDNYYSFLSPNTNITKLKDNAQKLADDEDRILRLVEEAVIDSAEQMPGIDKTIIILPVNPDEYFIIDKMGGVAGVALSQDTFVARIDPSFTDEGLKHLIAHEYHHTLQTEKRAEAASTLMEAFVMEGKADAFASVVYPDYSAPWTEPLSEKASEKVFDKLRKEGNDFDYKLYMEFLSGNSSSGITHWTNYRLGYQITQSYLQNNPEVSVEEWTGIVPKEIILGSEFKGVFEELESSKD
ncbi:DUF2268 domain-containing putative Zn-dependent protease [Bacillus sp. P14.5]|uniref:DUF2268 domain-containing protein n=1 Tax=Bacillus sp. P14.5 TaxID=1983400 RepID=UPI000DE962FC|nr:DUF2268 domain-containing putative Zn-dependent protease [Bacillus sp. P14.5]